MKLSSLFRLTAGAIFVQIAIGGLVTFGYVGPLPHIAMGSIVFALAVLTAAIALRSMPRSSMARGVSMALIAALVIQVALGFATLGTGSDLVAWVHLLLGVIVYAIALTGMAFSQREEAAARATSTPSV